MSRNDESAPSSNQKLLQSSTFERREQPQAMISSYKKETNRPPSAKKPSVNQTTIPPRSTGKSIERLSIQTPCRNTERTKMFNNLVQVSQLHRVSSNISIPPVHLEKQSVKYSLIHHYLQAPLLTIKRQKKKQPAE
jgi:hypothetical protein